VKLPKLLAEYECVVITDL